MNILIWILMIVGGAAGMLSTAYLVLAMPVIFGWKVYRKLKYHIGLYDRKNGSFGSRGKRGSHPAGTDGFFFCASNYNGKSVRRIKRRMYGHP